MDYLDQIRLAELNLVVKELSQHVDAGNNKDIKILEIGAGSGAQAKKLRELGFDVTAVDLVDSNHKKNRLIEIINFDGSNLPFGDQSFDVVYSSNVLEHVINKVQLNASIKRVLRNGGIALHYVPSQHWRVWSMLAFYPSLIKKIGNKLFGRIRHKSDPNRTPSNRTPSWRIRRWLFPSVHGTSNNIISEIYDFTEQSWDKFFNQLGWIIIKKNKNNFFLTGEMLLGDIISLKQRIGLSDYLGSTAYLYVLKND